MAGKTFQDLTGIGFWIPYPIQLLIKNRYLYCRCKSFQARTTTHMIAMNMCERQKINVTEP